jgi:hypothetical protein
MRPVLFLLEDPDKIAERVAAQMGCTTDEARFQMLQCDRFAVATFHVGNEYPREELH